MYANPKTKTLHRIVELLGVQSLWLWLECIGMTLRHPMHRFLGFGPAAKVQFVSVHILNPKPLALNPKPQTLFQGHVGGFRYTVPVLSFRD